MAYNINSNSFVTGTSVLTPYSDEAYSIGEENLRIETLYSHYANAAVTFTAINAEGDSITKGQVVFVTGVSGQTPTVALAACDDPNKMPAFGVAASNANNGAEVQIITLGSLKNVNTAGYSLGDTLYVQTGSGGTSGSFTKLAPTGSFNLLQNIGQVMRVDASGGQIKVGGAGRTNATPNLDKGFLFVGNDQDVSVADDTIFVSSSANLVGINTVDPTDTLDIDGSLRTRAGLRRAVIVHSASFTAQTSDHYYLISGSSTHVTASLPSLTDAGGGRIFVFKDADGNSATNNIVIQPSGSETIDSGTEAKIQNAWSAVTIIAGGALGWLIVGDR